MARTYKRLYGVDWPPELGDDNIRLIIAKKWREFKEDLGIEFKDPWVPLLDAAKHLFADYLKITEWTEQHFHDWVMEPMLITWGCASSGKSNDTGALFVLHWVTDPYDTVILVGSTTRDALRLRTWESIERYFQVLKNIEKTTGVAVPGKLVPTSCTIVNNRDYSDDPSACGGKAGLHGVALNDGGKLQGAHLPYVVLGIDELATIYNHQDVLTTIENLQIAKDFRFVGLANPESWSNPSCQYAIPETGINSVTVDTGCWRSTFGCFVRHHDGMKSPCVKNPALAKEFPFLTQQRHIDAALKRAGGNMDAPHFWKMVRGFPLPSGNDGQVVLDEAIARKNRAMDPGPPFDPATWCATGAGIDPAWTENGDNACYARCWVRRDAWGKPYLDYTNGLRKLTLNASEFNVRPAVAQMRDQVVDIMREPYSAQFKYTAVDASGNQGLADDLIIYRGAVDIMALNFATRSSETPLRAFDDRLIKDLIYDRGTEAWCVLAEFIRAGMVRGLPPEVISQLTRRRFASKMVKDATGMKRPAGAVNPLRLESKEDYCARTHDHSPDEADACAMAALAIKERIGLLPFGYVVSLPGQEAPQEQPGVTIQQIVNPASGDDYSAQSLDFDGLADGLWI